MTSESAEPEAKREWPLTWLAFAAFAVGLFAVLANLLNFHHYPAIRAEVALVLIALVAVAAGAAGIHRLAQPRISFLFTGLFVALLIDFGTDAPNFVFPLTAVVLAGVARYQERLVLKVTTAAFLSVLLFQSIDLAKADGRSAPPTNQAKRPQTKALVASQAPPIIHLVLDSYIGFDGMSALGTNFGNLRQQQAQFYLSRGFQLFPGAYSRHPKTINSLPEFLSYGKAKRVTEPRIVQFTTAPPLDYFIDLDRKGYRTSVQTPSFVDLCAEQPLTRCYNYNRSDLSTIANTDLSAADRALVIGFTVLELSQFTGILIGNTDLKLSAMFNARGRFVHNQAKLYSLTGFRQLDAFSRDLAGLEFGEARFIHLLIPHDPYIMDANCKLAAQPDWIDEHGPARITQRDAAYSRQVQCMTNGGLTRLLAALDQTSAGRAAIVIIQGDHGSRTVDYLPIAGAQALDPREMTVSHSGFFAIRVPGQASGQLEGRFALDELLGAFAASGFSAAPRPVAGPAEVYLMDPYWAPIERVALPPFAQKLPEN